MNRVNLSRTVTILANLGVIAGIIFLAFELQQNNELLLAQARDSRHEVRSVNTNRVFIQNPGLAELVVKARNHEPMSDAETYILERWFNQTLLNFQFIYVEYDRGFLELDDLPLASWSDYFDRYPGVTRYWNEQKALEFRPDFVTWFDENVLH